MLVFGLILSSICTYAVNIHDISNFDQWTRDIVSSFNPIAELQSSRNIHSLYVSNDNIYIGLNDGAVAIIYQHEEIKYYNIIEFRELNITDIIAIPEKNLLFISAYSIFTLKYHVSIFQYNCNVSTLKTILSINLSSNINAIASCYSSKKSELIIVLAGSNIILSIPTHSKSLTTTKINLNYNLNATSLSCTAFNDGYVIMIDNNCNKLLYIVDTFQIIQSFAIYPIENVEYNTILNENNSSNQQRINFIKEISFQNVQETWSLLLTATSVIQLDLSVLFSINAKIFHTDYLSLIKNNIPITNEIKALTIYRNDEQLGLVIGNQHTISLVITDIPSSTFSTESNTLSSVENLSFIKTIYEFACDDIRIAIGVKCHINEYGYHIQSKLGDGSHAIVWLAYQYQNNGIFIQKVAVKVFDKEPQFLSELCAMQRVHSQSENIPHLVSLIDSAYKIIILQYIAGGDIASIMKNSNGFHLTMDRMDIIIQFLLQISYPLSIMNDELYMMHADLKAENILIEHNFGSTLNVYLSDFSCVLDEEAYTFGSMGGTLQWLSPEMAQSIYVSHKKNSSSQFMCPDAYGLCLTAMHLYHSLCPKATIKGNYDVLCDVADKFDRAMSKFQSKEKNFFTAADALNKVIEERSNAMEWGLNYVKKLPKFRLFTNKKKKVLELLSVFLQRTPYNATHYGYITSTPSVCMSWSEWRSSLQQLTYRNIALP